MKIYIVSKEGEFVADITQKLYRFGMSGVERVEDCDVVVTIGGDGTILKAGKQAAKAGKPLLGINTGRLGFMATLEKDGVTSDNLERLKRGDYSVSRRMLLSVEIGGETLNALNDIVLQRKEQRLPDFRVFRGNTEVINISADGIIVCSPTGSTAYSLSAGGPIIEPESECFSLTALCPHTLFNRSMIFSPAQPLILRLQERDNVSVIIDGSEFVNASDEIVITKSDYVLNLIDIDGDNFYNSIHNKLMKPMK